MNAAELRIGNLLQTIQDKRPTKVTDIKIIPDTMCSENERWYIQCYGYDEDQVEPIPLTAEWLRKFKFEKHKSWYYLSMLELGDEYTIQYEPRVHDILYLLIGEKTILIENPSVHKLQNIYFSLTGKELVYE